MKTSCIFRVLHPKSRYARDQIGGGTKRSASRNVSRTRKSVAVQNLPGMIAYHVLFLKHVPV